jgi:hypothetical protein
MVTFKGAFFVGQMLPFPVFELEVAKARSELTPRPRIRRSPITLGASGSAAWSAGYFTERAGSPWNCSETTDTLG